MRRRKVPYRAHAAGHQRVQAALRGRGRHRQNADLHLFLAADPRQLAHRQDGLSVHGRTDQRALGVKGRHNIQPVFRKSGIGHQRQPQIPQPHQHRAVARAVAQEVLQIPRQLAHQIADLRPSGGAHRRKVFANLYLAQAQRSCNRRRRDRVVALRGQRFEIAQVGRQALQRQLGNVSPVHRLPPVFSGDFPRFFAHLFYHNHRRFVNAPEAFPSGFISTFLLINPK